MNTLQHILSEGILGTAVEVSKGVEIEAVVDSFIQYSSFSYHDPTHIKEFEFKDSQLDIYAEPNTVYFCWDTDKMHVDPTRLGIKKIVIHNIRHTCPFRIVGKKMDFLAPLEISAEYNLYLSSKRGTGKPVRITNLRLCAPEVKLCRPIKNNSWIEIEASTLYVESNAVAGILSHPIITKLDCPNISFNLTPQEYSLFNYPSRGVKSYVRGRHLINRIGIPRDLDYQQLETGILEAFKQAGHLNPSTNHNIEFIALNESKSQDEGFSRRTSGIYIYVKSMGVSAFYDPEDCRLQLYLPSKRFV